MYKKVSYPKQRSLLVLNIFVLPGLLTRVLPGRVTPYPIAYQDAHLHFYLRLCPIFYPSRYVAPYPSRYLSMLPGLLPEIMPDPLPELLPGSLPESLPESYPSVLPEALPESYSDTYQIRLTRPYQSAYSAR
jgi:hypothetical protein